VPGGRDSPPGTSTLAPDRQRTVFLPLMGRSQSLPRSIRHANICSTVIACVLLPRFELAVAAGGRELLVTGPAALAPEPGREQNVGQASAAAEAFGVRAGMRLGEALARCPELQLVQPDPAGVADEWDRVLAALEGIGAAVESGRPGVAWFAAGGLLNLHGGIEGVLAAARHSLRPRPARLGAAPSRFAALAAAGRARPRRPEIIGDGPALARGRGGLAAYLAPLPVALLDSHEETAGMREPLERLGIATLGDLRKLSRSALSDRFGRAGESAHDLAHGRDRPLRPRTAGEQLEEMLELPDSASGQQLERALGLLIDRLLARPERRGRTVRAAVVSAKLVEGGTWRVRVTFREALADPRRMRLALALKLAELPAPADVLRLRAEGFGPPSGEQRSLIAQPAAARAARLREAIRQARAAAGPEAALRILPVDPDSRVPERRLALTPWEV
jgi:protein ImuB